MFKKTVLIIIIITIIANCKTIAETYLMNLSRDGRIEKMKEAIAKGADVKIRDNYNLDAIVYAAMNEKKEAVDLLYKSGADKNKIDISYILKWGNSVFAEQIIDLGCNPDYKGQTKIAPLFYAISSKNKNLFSKLIKADANLDITTEKGATLLHFAIENNNNNVIQFLLKNGANVNAKNNDDVVPLHLAAEAKNYKIMQQLIDLGADINAKDKNNATTAFRAALFNDIEMMKLLIKNKADLNIESAWGTPFIQAKKQKNKKMMEVIKK